MGNTANKSFEITAYGHPNIRATHKTTWQLTREDHLSTKGDCIIGVGASHAVSHLPEWFKDHINAGEELQYTIRCGEFEIKGMAQGHCDLSLTDEIDIVMRRSDFISTRTIGVQSTIVANDIPEAMVNLMKNPMTVISVNFLFDDI